MMLTADHLQHLNAWIAQTVASLNADLDTAKTESEVRRVDQGTRNFLQTLESRKSEVDAALLAVRQEIAQGRLYRQHRTTWTRRLAQLTLEKDVLAQTQTSLQTHITATHRMLTDIEQEIRRRSREQTSIAPIQPTMLAPASPAQTTTPRPLRALAAVGLSAILLVACALIGIFATRQTTTSAPVTRTTVLPILEPPTLGPATEAADLIQPGATVTLPPPALPADTVATGVLSASTNTPVKTLAPTATNSPTPAPTAKDNANLRAGPGTNYPIVGTLTAGQTLRIIARNPTNDWYQLANGMWIFGELVANAPAVPVASMIPTLPPPTKTPAPPTATPAITFRPPARACCKICTTGKACGDTCIARNKTCHVGPGCACDG